MKEIKGNLFAYVGRKGFMLCITTNGFVKNDGTGVMGRGNAREAAELIPDLPSLLGKSLKKRGNVVSRLTDQIYAFPVKHEWMQDADKKLIKRSVAQLLELATAHPRLKYILPRPGCGNGGLKYRYVKPLLEVLPDNVWVITNGDV